jgi:hypothetical protein
VDGISRRKEIRIVQSSHPMVLLPWPRQRVRNLIVTKNAARTIRAMLTALAFGATLRIGAWQALACHA